MSDFLTKYHCILDYQSDRVGWSRLSMHAARCRSDRLTVQHILLGPGTACMFLTHYEINLDQRILDPEICMHACMAGRLAGRR